MEPPPPQPSPDESPTRYMLPDKAQDVRKGYVDYSLNPHQPAKYPVNAKKRKKSDNKDNKKKKKKIKQEPPEGKQVHFQSKVTVKTIYDKLHHSMQEIELTCEDDYLLRNGDFALKR